MVAAKGYPFPIGPGVADAERAGTTTPCRRPERGEVRLATVGRPTNLESGSVLFAGAVQRDPEEQHGHHRLA